MQTFILGLVRQARERKAGGTSIGAQLGRVRERILPEYDMLGNKDLSFVVVVQYLHPLDTWGPPHPIPTRPSPLPRRSRTTWHMEGKLSRHEPLAFSRTKKIREGMRRAFSVAFGSRLDLALAGVALGGDTGDGVGLLLLYCHTRLANVAR